MEARETHVGQSERERLWEFLHRKPSSFMRLLKRRENVRIRIIPISSDMEWDIAETGVFNPFGGDRCRRRKPEQERERRDDEDFTRR